MTRQVETAKIAAKKMLGVSTFMKASVHLEDRKNVHFPLLQSLLISDLSQFIFRFRSLRPAAGKESRGGGMDLTSRSVF